MYNALSLFFNSGWGFVSFAVIAFIIAFYFSKNKKVFLISLAVALLLGMALKSFYLQDRPCVDGFSMLTCQLLDQQGGFPSMHAVIATMLALGVLGTDWFYPMIFISLVVSASRVWLGVHSVAQVAGGMAFAAMVFLTVYHLNHKFYGDYPDVDMDSMFNDNLLNKKVSRWD